LGRHRSRVGKGETWGEVRKTGNNSKAEGPVTKTCKERTMKKRNSQGGGILRNREEEPVGWRVLRAPPEVVGTLSGKKLRSPPEWTKLEGAYPCPNQEKSPDAINEKREKLVGARGHFKTTGVSKQHRMERKGRFYTRQEEEGNQTKGREGSLSQTKDSAKSPERSPSEKERTRRGLIKSKRLTDPGWGGVREDKTPKAF